MISYNLQKELDEYKKQFINLKLKVDEFELIIELKKKENAELEEQLKNSEEKCRNLEAKYAIMNIHSEIITKNKFHLSKENNSNESVLSLKKPGSTAKMALDIYSVGINPHRIKKTYTKDLENYLTKKDHNYKCSVSIQETEVISMFNIIIEQFEQKYDY